jgi:hypothetical protein
LSDFKNYEKMFMGKQYQDLIYAFQTPTGLTAYEMPCFAYPCPPF